MRMGRSYGWSAAVAAGLVLIATAVAACSDSPVSSGPDASAPLDGGQSDSRTPDAQLVDAPDTSSPGTGGPEDAGQPGDAADGAAPDDGRAFDGSGNSDSAGYADGTANTDSAGITDGGEAGASADGGPSFSCTSAMPSLARAVAPILVANCGAELCHGGTAFGAFGGAPGAHAALVNVPSTRDKCDAGVLVSPGSLSKSYLMNKLTGAGMCPGTARMPSNHPAPLPTADIQTIADWICGGALNN